MARVITARQRLSVDGCRANSSRNGHGKLRTHCLTGASGITWSIKWADVSIMRRAPHDGQKPRSLQEKE